MPNNSVPEETREIMKNLKDKGMSNNFIAQVTGYSKKTVSKYVSEGEIEEIN